FPVRALVFGPDGRTLTSAAGFRTSPRAEVEVTVWDLRTHRVLATHTGFQEDLNCLAFSADGKALVTAPREGGLRLWGPHSYLERVRLGEHRSTVSALAFSADGAVLAWGDIESFVVLGNPTGNGSVTRCSGHGRQVLSLAFAPDGGTLASGSYDTTIRIWDVP